MLWAAAKLGQQTTGGRRGVPLYRLEGLPKPCLVAGKGYGSDT